jgi:L-lactate dehydrogenase complex protein LldF
MPGKSCPVGKRPGGKASGKNHRERQVHDNEEIGLNHFLEKETRVKIYEGDLGEFIVQQRGTIPFHIVGPAINLNVQEIAGILTEHIDMPYTEAAPEIAGHVRNFLRDKFEKADMGITGVNQAIASTGSLLLVENEGNIRWATSAPRVHVALMSIEKVCAHMSEAFHLLGLLTQELYRPGHNQLCIIAERATL